MSQRFWYLAGVGTFIVPMGMQTILFPWFGGGCSSMKGSERLGLAQNVHSQLPAIFLILFWRGPRPIAWTLAKSCCWDICSPPCQCWG